RTISTQERHAFDADVIRHYQNHLVAFGGAYHRQADAGISACGFNDRSAGLDTSLAFSGFDHAQSDTVFDTAAWVHRFQLHQNLCPWILRNTLQTDDRGTANNVADAVVDSVVHILYFCRITEEPL